MFVDEQKRIDMLQKLRPLQFEAGPLEDAHDFVDRCYAFLRTLGLVESNRVDFTTFQL